MGCYCIDVVLLQCVGPAVNRSNTRNSFFTLQWCHNDHNDVWNHQSYDCFLNRLFGRRSKKTSKLRVTGLCAGNSPGLVNSPHKGPVTRKTFPFDAVIMNSLLPTGSVSCTKNLWHALSFVSCRPPTCSSAKLQNLKRERCGPRTESRTWDLIGSFRPN